MSSSYRKSIKGDSNQQSEEFSHNRVSVHFDGAAPVVLVLFFAGLVTAAIVWLVIHFGGLLLVTLLALWLVGVTGGMWLAGVWIYSRTGILLSERRRARNLEQFLSAPAEHHSIYLQEPQPHYSIHEVSANVVAAGVTPPTVKQLSNTKQWDEVDDLRAKAVGMHQIADKTGIPYGRIRTYLNLREGNQNAM